MTFTPPGTLGANATVNPVAAPQAAPFAGAGNPLPPCSVNPTLCGAFTSLIGANVTHWTRNAGGSATISNLSTRVNVASGNIAVAVHAGSPGATKPGAQLATTGSIPCPAAGWVTIPLGGSVAVDPTCWLAVAADNTTATFIAAYGSAVGYQQTALAFGFSAYQGGAFPPPANPNPTVGVTVAVLLIGS